MRDLISLASIKDHPQFNFLRNAIYSNDIPHEVLLFTIENTENQEMIVALLKRVGDIYTVLKKKYDQLMIDNTIDLGISVFVSKNLNEIELMERIRLNLQNHEIIRIGNDYFVYSADCKERELKKAFFYDPLTGFLEPNLSPFPNMKAN